MKKSLYLKNAIPTILSCIAALGVIGTAIITAKATPKALKKLKDAENKKGEFLTRKETVMSVAPVYIPAVFIGVGTICCIFGANSLNKKQQAALMSAYGIVSDAYKKYMSKVRQIYGEEAHQKVLREIEAEKAKDISITIPDFIGGHSLDIESMDDEERLFYDSFSQRYFTSTFSKVLQAEYHLNRNFCLGLILSVNDFYDLLGLSHTDIGEQLGWTGVEGDYAWIDFYHFESQIDDSLECCVIDTIFPPTADYNNY